MNESMDRVVADWLHEGPERGPREGLERALAATRRVGQRPGWTLPERWIPMQLTMTRTRSQRPIFAIATLALLIVALVATALYIGSQRRAVVAVPQRRRRVRKRTATCSSPTSWTARPGRSSPVPTTTRNRSSPIRATGVAFVRSAGRVASHDGQPGRIKRERAGGMPGIVATSDLVARRQRPPRQHLHATPSRGSRRTS